MLDWTRDRLATAPQPWEAPHFLRGAKRQNLRYRTHRATERSASGLLLIVCPSCSFGAAGERHSATPDPNCCCLLESSGRHHDTRGRPASTAETACSRAAQNGQRLRMAGGVRGAGMCRMIPLLAHPTLWLWCRKRSRSTMASMWAHAQQGGRQWDPRFDG